MLLVFAGTDILKKRLQEQGEDTTDFSHLKANQLHPGGGPHQHRSHSLILKRAGPAEPGGDLESEDYPPPRNTTPLSALVSSAMDCAIAGSSSHVVGNLHQLEGKDHHHQQLLQQQQQQQPHIGSNSLPLENRINGHGRGGGSSRDNLHKLQAETLQQVNARPPPLSRNHSGRNLSTRPEKFSDLLNSKVISDHFDQYGTLRDDSGLGRDLDTHELEEEERYRLEDEDEFHIGAQMDRSPDSGVSDTDDVYRSRSRPLQRRKTLPSLMKHANSFKAKPQANKSSKGAAGEVVHSHQNLSAEDTDTYIIENGIRKRIKAEVYTQPPTASTETLSEKPKHLPKRYKLESPVKLRANRGSLPDVTVCKELGKTVMPREEASRLSHQRREELRILREEEEKRKQQEIVLRLTDLKVSCFFLGKLRGIRPHTTTD